MAARCFSLYCFFVVSRLAKEQIGPVVREMEEAGHVKPAIVDMLFGNGVRLMFYSFIFLNLI